MSSLDVGVHSRFVDRGQKGRAIVSIKRLIAIVPLIGLLLTGSTPAQNLPSRIVGQFDSDVPMPSSNGLTIGSLDALAVSELQTNSSLIDTTTWSGMQAIGTVTSSSNTDALPVTISMSPGNQCRIDITEAGGHDLSVTKGGQGWHVSADGKVMLDPPLMAITRSLALRLPTSVLQQQSNYAVRDHGLMTVSGESVRRISIETEVPAKRRWPVAIPRQAVVDLYFDSKTHLMFKSASLIPIPGTMLPVLMRVLTYSDYTTSNGHTFPGTIVETVNGQLTRTFHLTSIDYSTIPAASLFSF